MISDSTGYTLDFTVYTGKSENHHEHGLAYGVVKDLIAPYIFQRYFVFFDNYYTSTQLLEDLYKQEVYATGTFRVDRHGIPEEVKALKVALSGSKVTHGTGHYIQFENDLSQHTPHNAIAYVCWRDTRAVCAMSAAYPGHAINIVSRKKVVRKTGTVETSQILRPIII